MNLTVQRNKQDLKTFLSENLKISKSRAKDIIDSRRVFVNDRRVWIATYGLKIGDVVSVEAPEHKKDKQDEVVILYEDESIIAANKPPDILADKEGDSLEALLRRQTENPGLRAIHRLDRETSGVILYAKNNEVFEAFKELWMEKNVEKIYYAISLKEASFTKRGVAVPIDGKRAVSHIELASKARGLSCFKVIIETGRKHQVRVHLASLGHPVLGEKFYNKDEIKGDWQKSIKRHMLHAYEIKFTSPVSNKPIDIIAPFPGDFVEYARKAGLAINDQKEVSR